MGWDTHDSKIAGGAMRMRRIRNMVLYYDFRWWVCSNSHCNPAHCCPFLFLCTILSLFVHMRFLHINFSFPHYTYYCASFYKPTLKASTPHFHLPPLLLLLLSMAMLERRENAEDYVDERSIWNIFHDECNIVIWCFLSIGSFFCRWSNFEIFGS